MFDELHLQTVLLLRFIENMLSTTLLLFKTYKICVAGVGYIDRCYTLYEVISWKRLKSWEELWLILTHQRYIFSFFLFFGWPANYVQRYCFLILNVLVIIYMNIEWRQDCKRNNEWYPCSGFETFLREMRLLAASLVFTFLFPTLVSPKKKAWKDFIL